MKNIYSPSFRSMSRRLALTLGLLLALLLSLPSHAQDGQSKVPINRTISGFTLGVTTPAQARAIIQRQGGKIIPEDSILAGSNDVNYTVTGLNYARRPTQTVYMYFYKGHLRRIVFIFDDLDVLEQIESELEDKYGTMAEGVGTSNMKSKVVFDAFTRLLVVRGFKHEGHLGFKDAYIIYSDEELDRARSAEKKSEI